MNKYIFIFTAVLALSACAKPQGKLAASYKDIPVQTDIIQGAVESPLSVTVPITQIHGAGLIGAIVGGLATEVSRQKRMPGIREIQAVMKPKEVYSLMGDSTLKTVKDADWIKVNKTLKLKNYSVSDRKAVVKNHLLDTKEPTRTVVQSYIRLGEYFDNLVQFCHVTIYPVNNAKDGRAIYTLTLTSAYVPPNLAATKDFTNYRIWTANNSAELKKGIRKTTKEINAQLKDWLKNPRSVVDKTPKPKVMAESFN